MELALLTSSTILCLTILGVGYKLLSAHFRAQADKAILQKVRVIQDLMAGQLRDFSSITAEGTRGPADNHALVDQVKSLMGVECTLFQNETRVSTTIVKADGRRAIGTKMDNPKVIEKVLLGGEIYLGANMILGKEYETAYAPLKDSNGKITGMLFLGESLEAIHKAYWSLLSAIGTVTGLFLVLVYLGCRRVIKGMTDPLEAVGSVLGNVAKGNLTVQARVASEDELGDMSRALNAMVEQLRHTR